MSGLKAKKKRARSESLDRLAGLAPIRDRVSGEIMERLVGSPLWAGADLVMAYLALPSEVSLDGLWSAIPRPRLAAPRVEWRGGVMEPVLLDDPIAGVEIRAHGVREPVGDGVADAGALDLVLVPGLAFDPEGRRLGRGGGFYDRFLPRAASAVRIGVCWSGQVVDRVPSGEGDERVHMLVTEDGLRGCAGRSPDS